MNTRSIAVVAVFAAVSIALNAVRIPTIYWPGLYYTFAEIPIAVAFILFGFRIGILAEALHILGVELLFPRGLVAAATYPLGVVSITLMLFGVYLATRIIARRVKTGKPPSEKKSAAYLTALGIAARGGIMPFFDYGLMYHILLPLTLGYVIPEAYIVALIPSFIVYNITVALFTIPIAYGIAVRVSKYLRIEPALLKKTQKS